MTDFEKAYNDMKQFGTSVPKIENLAVRNAKEQLRDGIAYILKKKNAKEPLKWISAYDVISDWLTCNYGRGLFMHGDCGLGKSLIGMYVIPAIYYAQLGKVVTVASVTDMNAKPDDMLKKRFISIDDIGTEDESVVYGNRRLVFPEIIDNAEKKGNIVIISTNLNKAQLIEKYGNRTLERIISTTKRVEFKGESLRS